MKKICIFTYTNPVCGGTDRMAVELANVLCDKFDITILGIYGEKKSYFKIDERVKLDILFKAQSKCKYLKIFSRKLNHKINKLQKYLANNKIDLIIDVDTALTEISTPASQPLGITHISWDHYSETLLKTDGIRKKAFEINAKHSNKVVVLTKDYLNFYKKSGLYKAENLYQIYNLSPVNFDKAITHNNSKTVLSVGRYHRQKGYDMLLKAWKLVEQSKPDWCLKIYGRKQEEFDNIKNLKNELQLNNVFLSEEINNIKAQYKDAEIYVMSSRWEGHPLSLIEACCASLPLVSFDCKCGPKEIIENGINGFLIEQDNVNKLAEGILSLINDKNQRETFSKNSFEISEKFSKDKFKEQWLGLIQDLI